MIVIVIVADAMPVQLTPLVDPVHVERPPSTIQSPGVTPVREFLVSAIHDALSESVPPAGTVQGMLRQPVKLWETNAMKFVGLLRWVVLTSESNPNVFVTALDPVLATVNTITTVSPILYVD